MLFRSEEFRRPARFRRTAALLLTLAFTITCLTAPAGEFRTVYADSQLITITSQPESVTVNNGETATFSVTATGTGLSYQWYFKKYGEKNWTLWSGHTSAAASVVIDDTWNLAEVYCRITGNTGVMADSDSAVIRVKKPICILTEPQDLTVKAGQKIVFSVSAQGSGELRYQWFIRKPGDKSWLRWEGQTKSETNATANAELNLIQVYCRVTDSLGRNARSTSATLYVIQPIKIITHPESVKAEEGSTIKLTTLAQGTGDISYQWFFRKPGSKSWSLWNGYTSPVITLQAKASLDGTEVYCRATDSRGARINTNSAKITIFQKLIFTTQPSDGTYFSGDKVQFSAKAEGYGNLKYQWYFRKAGNSDWTLWKGMNKPEITAQADCTWHFMEVCCRVTDDAGQTLDSSKAIITITKKSDKRYIKRTFTVNGDKTKIYSAPGTSNTCVGTLNSGERYLALEWGCDSSDSTWYRFDWNGKTAWIPRSKTSVSDEFVTIPNRSFKDGGMPVIYLSPSRQTKNEYAAGSTTEGIQMNRVGDELKKILLEEYWCIVYMPPIEMPISLCRRPLDAYNKEADIYLAIHTNAHSSKVKYGAIGYYFPGSEQSKKLGENMADEMGKISPFTPNVGSKTINGMKGFDNVGYAEVRDPAYFGMVSLLAEVEYHDNADSALWIIDHPKEIARALANALEKTFDIQKR